MRKVLTTFTFDFGALQTAKAIVSNRTERTRASDAPEFRHRMRERKHKNACLIDINFLLI